MTKIGHCPDCSGTALEELIVGTQKVTVFAPEDKDEPEVEGSTTSVDGTRYVECQNRDCRWHGHVTQLDFEEPIHRARTG